MSILMRDTTVEGNAAVHVGNNIFLPAENATLKSHRVIPFDRNLDVVVRNSIFAKLETLLPPSPDYRSAALWGLGGSGKTQVALEYAWRRAKAPACSVFWVHADDEATFAQSYKKIADELGLGDFEGEKLLEEVKKRIQAERCWVLVLDNADNLKLFGVGQASATTSLRGFIPHAVTGTVLWTSRDEGIKRLVGPPRAINVARMTENEAMSLLETGWGKAVGDEMDDAKALLSELDWLPLAISQAAAYLWQTDMPIKEYLSKLRDGKKRWEVLKQSQFDRHRRVDVPNSILETWAISIEQIRVESSIAYNILHVQAFLDNENIPYELIQKAANLGDGDGVDDEDVRTAAARLQHFSFFAKRADGLVYDMHKLVQEAARYSLKEDAAHFARAALRVMADLFPERRRELWDTCEKYLVHTQRAAEWTELSGQPVETARLLTRISTYLYDRGRWKERELVNVKTHALRKTALGEKHPDTIRNMAELAVTYHERGRYDDDEKLSVEVLALRREVLGEKHPDTIWSMTSLATIYNSQRKYDDAEKIYIEALALQREILGEKHPDTIWSMAVLAGTYHYQGKHDAAEKINVEVLALRREALGERHPDTIWSMARLAMTYHSQGRSDEAEKIHRNALTLRREMLGVNHPDTLLNMYYLAQTRYKLGRKKEAAEMMEECYELRRVVLGADHPFTRDSERELSNWKVDASE